MAILAGGRYVGHQHSAPIWYYWVKDVMTATESSCKYKDEAINFCNNKFST